MKKHPYAAKPGEPRNIFIGMWLNKSEHEIFVKRYEASGARNKSEYQRAALLTGAQLYVRDERADMNAVMRLTGAIQRAPSSQAQMLALEEAIETLRRMAR